MKQGCVAAFERLEIHGVIIRCAFLPTPREDADPCECQGSHGRLVRLAVVTLLRIIDLCPEGMPRGLRRPLHERVAQERRTLEAPVHPGLLATAFRDRRDARVFLELVGRGEAFPLFAEGDEAAGSKHRSGPWQGSKQREVGRLLGTLRHGCVEVGNGLQRDAELGHEGVHQEHIGSDDTVIGGERHGTLDGLEAGVDDVGSAHVGAPEEGFQGGAAGELGGFEGWPAAEDVAKERRIFRGKPLQDLWKVVVEHTGQAVCATDCVTDEAPAVFDELGEGTPGGALGSQGLELVTVCEEECDLEFRVGGVVCGSAGGKRCAVRGHGERSDRKKHEEIILAQCPHDGPFIQLKTHRDGVSVEPRAQSLDPRVDRCRAVREDQKLSSLRASSLEADIVCGVSPVAANKSRKGFGGLERHV